MLKSNRISIRAIEESDLQIIANWRNDPSVYEFFYEYLPISLREQRAWFERQLSNSNELNFIVSANDSGTAIGTVSIYGIDRRNRKAEWGRLLIGSKDHQSGGYGSEIEALILEYAFEHLNLHKLSCEVIEDNHKVISLHEKFGFQRDGTLRDHAFKGGKYISVVSLSMLENEYINERYNGKLKSIRDRMFN